MITLQELYDSYKDTACEEGLKFLQGCISQELTVEEVINLVDPESLFWVALRTETPVDILEKLGKHNDWELRYTVTGNPSTPAHILEMLSNDTDRDVRNRALSFISIRGLEGKE